MTDPGAIRPEVWLAHYQSQEEAAKQREPKVTAYIKGYTAMYRGIRLLACPYCGEQMRVYQQPADPSRNYPDGVYKHLVKIIKCLNADCPYLFQGGKTEKHHDRNNHSDKVRV